MANCEWCKVSGDSNKAQYAMMFNGVAGISVCSAHYNLIRDIEKTLHIIQKNRMEHNESVAATLR